jgi:cytochrome b561
MVESLTRGRQDSRATFLGWLVFIVCAVMLWNSINLPRTPLDLRAGPRAIHSTVGLIVIIAVSLRLAWLVRGPTPRPPSGLPENSFGFNRAVLVALLLTFALTGLIGFPYAWADGQEVSLFGIHIPRLVGTSRALRGTLGYIHSALAFYYLMLFGVWIVYGLYQNVRYKTGLLRLLPGSRV